MSVKNDTRNTFAKVEKDAKAAGQRAGKGFVAPIAAAAIAMGAVKFFKGAFEEAQEARKVGAQTAAVLKSTGGAARVTAGDIDSLASSISKKTGIDDEQIAAGENMLLTFTNVRNEVGKGNDIFTQATRVVTDMAAATGQDSVKANVMLGKALNDPIKGVTALTKIGVTFTDGQRKQIKTMQAHNNMAGAQKVILAELTKEFGGSAEAQATAADKAKVAWGNFLEDSGTKMQPMLDGLLNTFVKVVNGWGDLGAGAQAALTTVGGGVVVFGVAAVAISKLSTGIRAARDAYRAMGITAKGASIAAAGVGAVIGIAALAFGAWAEKSAKAKQAVDDYTEALKEDNNQIGANVRLMAAKKLQDMGAFDAAKKLGISLDDVTAAALGNADAQAKLNPLLDAYIDAAQNSADVDSIDRKNAAIDLMDAIGGQNKAVTTAVANAKDLGVAAGTAGSKTAGAGAQVKTAGERAKDAAKKLQDLAAAMFHASEGALSLSGKEIDFQQAVDDASAAVKENGKTLNTNTQKGRDNKTALNNLVIASQGYIEKLVETGASSKKVTAASKTAKEEFIRVATKMGVGRDRAKELANAYFHIPKKVTTKHEAPGAAAAKKAAQDLKKKIQELRGKGVHISFSSNADEVARAYNLHLANRARRAAGPNRGGTDRHGGVSASAAGGLIRGPGTGTSDSILGMDSAGTPTSWVSNGEYVVNARQTSKNLRVLEAINKGMDVPALAGGGNVSRNITVRSGSLGMSGVPAMFDQLANRAAVGIGDRLASSLGNALRDAAASSGSGSGPVIGSGNLAKNALSHVGDSYAIGRCLQFVRTMAGAPGMGGNAVGGWNRAHYKHRNGHAPSGVPVWWGGGDGHVAVSVGNGNIVSTDWPHAGHIGLTSINRLTRSWHKPFRGWSSDVNGVVTNRASIKMGNGGVIRERVFGVGDSGQTYQFGEKGQPETVTPGTPQQHSGGGGFVIENHIEIGGEVVKVVKRYIDEHDRSTRRKVLAGDNGGF